MAVDTYGPGIQVPVSKQKASASQYAIPMRAAVIDLDARVQDYEANQVITSGMVNATGFTATLHGVLLFAGAQQLAVVTLNIAVGTTVTVGATGNITDTLMCTLPAALVPNQAWFGSIGNGANQGDVTIAANGQVIIRCWTPSQNIASGTTLSLTAVYPTAE